MSLELLKYQQDVDKFC